MLSYYSKKFHVVILVVPNIFTININHGVDLHKSGVKKALRAGLSVNLHALYDLPGVSVKKNVKK